MWNKKILVKNLEQIGKGNKNRGLVELIKQAHGSLFGGQSKTKGVGRLKLPRDTEVEQMELHEVLIRYFWDLTGK